MKKSILKLSSLLIIAIVNINIITAQITNNFSDERDQKEYKTVKIGNQIWMAENLAYETNTGCWAYNDNKENVDKYGYLYSLSTSKKVCPIGWHLPTDAEWTQLENYLIKNSFSYDETKDNKGIAKSLASNNIWTVSNKKGAVGNTDFSNSRNKTGFSALPGGFRENHGGAYINKGNAGYWWTATEAMMAPAYSRRIDYNNTKVSHDEDNELSAISVRCIKD